MDKTVSQELARLRIDPMRIIVTGDGNIEDVFHTCSTYEKILKTNVEQLVFYTPDSPDLPMDEDYVLGPGLRVEGSHPRRLSWLPRKSYQVDLIYQGITKGDEAENLGFRTDILAILTTYLQKRNSGKSQDA